MKKLKKLLRRIPGLVNTYAQVRYVIRAIYRGWYVDSQKMLDEFYLNGAWNYEAPVEMERYLRVMRAVAVHLGTENMGDVLEAGCSQGVFTAQLAQRSHSVLATDISQVACSRAAERCARYKHVQTVQLNLIRDAIPGVYDIVFAMDVFEMIYGRSRLNNVARKLSNAAREGGLLVFCGCRLSESWRDEWLARLVSVGSGDNLIAFLGKGFGLRLVHREIYPEASLPGYRDHVIALFERINLSGPD